MERKAIVELNGAEYVFGGAKAAGLFIQALENAEGTTRQTWKKEPKPLVAEISVTMRLIEKGETFVEPCERCNSAYTAPKEDETHCENCLEELRKVDYPCTGTIEEKDGEEAHTCTRVVSMLPEKAEEEGEDNILCYSCAKKAKEAENDD